MFFIRKKKLGILLVLCFSAVISLLKAENPIDNDPVKQTPAEPKDLPAATEAVSDESEKDRLFRKDVILRTNEILEKVQQYYPNLAEKLNAEDKDRFLKALVNTLSCGLEYCSSSEAAEKKHEDIEKTAPYPAIIIAAQKVLYARIDTFSPTITQQFKADLISSFRLANPPSGLILDLRNSHGDQIEEGLKTIGLFVKAEKIPLPEGVEPFPRCVKTPVLILVGEKTTGAAELFSLLLTNVGQAMPIGEKTAGKPFIKEKIPLSNGDFLKIPKIPRYLSSVKPSAVEPAIKTNAYPQIEFKKLREEAGSEINDQCLQRAIELIICLQALTPESK